MYFNYGVKETEYLMSKDKKLAEVIDRIGHIYRPVDTDLFASVVHHIIGQQISMKAQATIWQRMMDTFGEVTPNAIGHSTVEQLQLLGMTYRKAGYIKDFSEKILAGRFDLDAVENLL